MLAGYETGGAQEQGNIRKTRTEEPSNRGTEGTADHLTLMGSGWGSVGGMGDLAGKEFFPPNPLVIEFFFLTYNGRAVRFFSRVIRHERYFFQCRNPFSPGIIYIISDQ